MKCIFCSCEDTRVLDKRDSEGTTRRRRECMKCEKRFTTYERAEITLTVLKKDGKKEEFSREKMKAGIMKAFTNRPVTEEQIEDIVDEIEARLVSLGPEIGSNTIGDLIMKKLKKVDKVAYIRFASVYREFDDIESFEKELKALKKAT